MRHENWSLTSRSLIPSRSNYRFLSSTQTIKLPNLLQSMNRNINDPNILTFDITLFEIISEKERSASNTFLAINRLLTSSPNPFQESNIIELCKHYALTRSFSASPTHRVYRRFSKQFKHAVFTSERSKHRRIYQPGVFRFHRIDHAFLPPSVSKQLITSFPHALELTKVLQQS